MRRLSRLVMVVSLTGTVLVVVGALGPWAIIRGTSISHAGVDGNVGWTTAGLAACALVILVIAYARRIGWLALTAAIPAVTATALSCYYANDPSAFLANPGEDIANRGWGVTLDVVAGIVLTVCCVLVWVQGHYGKTTPAAPAGRNTTRAA